jgi:hypothetical protein
MATAKPRRRTDGEIVLVTGSPGAGKTVYTMREAAPASRLIVWDAHLEWSEKGCAPCPDIPSLVAACRTREPGHVAFTGRVSPEHFEAFCRVALLWGRLAPCTVVVEELADVTNPGKAPHAWGDLLRWARKLSINVYAITQRPSESDKTIVGLAHRIVCHAMARHADQLYMARELGLEHRDVASLDRTRLEHIERLPDFKTRRGFTQRPQGRRA